MKRWYLICEEDSSVLYREVFGPFRSLGDALEAVIRVRRALEMKTDSIWEVDAILMYERYALALSSEAEIKEVK
jgi:hypothetical protein